MLKHICSKLTGRSEQNKLPTHLDSLVTENTEKYRTYAPGEVKITHHSDGTVTEEVESIETTSLHD